MRKTPIFIGFIQAAGLMIYVSAVGFVMQHGGEWFGQTDGFLTILLVLTLFATSALICAAITLGYPAHLIWRKKEFKEALQVVIYTAAWLVSGILVTALTIYLAVH